MPRLLYMLAVCALAAVSCSKDEPKHAKDAGPARDAAAGTTAGSAGAQGQAGTSGGAGSGGAGQAGGFGVPIGSAASKLDLLFVIDDSRSMEQEQAALRREFPRLIRKLVSGDHDEDGEVDHRRVTDLHLGVVSSDMGTQVSVQGCAPLGKDGVLQHAARSDELDCAPSYPSFLRYVGSTDDASDTLEALAQDFGCIATLGTSGCGFEQHFEASLKAVWPSRDPRITFQGASGWPSLGHGDGANAGFLRNQDAVPSTLAVVFVADEDDCSAFDHRIYAAFPTDQALASQPLNLRCFHNKDKLQPLERYLFGLRNLGHARVMYAAIVGVPVDLVDADAREGVDFSSARDRDAYYDEVLADPRMQEEPDPDAMHGPNEDLKIACESTLGRAYPGRRFVNLAKALGEDALVQSICGDSFRTPIDLIVEEVTQRVD